MTKLATPAEVAEHLGVTPEALRQWAHRGVGPRYIKVQTARRYRWTDVEEYLNSNTTAPGEDAPRLDCSVCRKPVRSNGHLGIRNAHVARARNEQREWDNRPAGPIEGDAWNSVPSRATWHILHDDCDPDPSAATYWYAIERVNTHRKFLSFLAHVNEKRWARENTDLTALIRRVLGE